MRALAFAWRSLVRQPARSALGVLGVAAVGALLFDMLLLSNGLISSMRDLLERTGYDVRVTATGDLPRNGPLIRDVTTLTDRLARLPGIDGVLTVRFVDAELRGVGGAAVAASIEGVRAARPSGNTAAVPWSVTSGRDIRGPDEIVVTAAAAARLGVSPGGHVVARASCGDAVEALPPVTLRIVGVATFPFALANQFSAGTRLATVAAACGERTADLADMILVASAGDPGAAVREIRRAHPDLGVATNEEMLGRIQRTGFTYFQQISAVLTTVTLTFAVLLITVLLTVSVNQRLGEIAALRALGLSRGRLAADVICESVLIVGTGALLSLPLGALLAVWLDHILKRMPGIPVDLHFFVFEPRALLIHLGLLTATALLAAAYPTRIVARLPIAATLRQEVIG